MSVVNSTILELSQQIALLHAENKRLQMEIECRVLTKSKRPMKPRATSVLQSWARKLNDEKYEQLCEQYRDDIAIIQRRYPRWKPQGMFFDIEG